MTDEQPTQPLTDAELSAIRALWGDILNSNTEETSFGASMVPADVHLFDLKFAKVLAEVHRLRAALSALGRNEQAACNRSMELQEENERIRAEATGTALGHLAKIERLQSQRDALVRKLGLDWGPDEFGDLDAATNGQQSCGDASIWSCALGDHCVCKKTKHGGRHECACGSWWVRDN